MIKALQGGGLNGSSMLALQVDTELVERLMPELRDCRGQLDSVRRQTAIEVVNKWHRELIHSWNGATKAERERIEKDREALQNCKTALESTKFQLQETQGDLRAAKEGRGIYEDRARAELQRKLAAKELLIEKHAELEETQQGTIASLQAELRGRLATTQRYEHDISQLTTASAANAEQVRKDKKAMDDLIKDARTALSRARDDITSRWGAELSPFMQAIYDNIVIALTKLPPAA